MYLKMYKQGQKDARTYYGGQAFSSFTRNVRAEDAIKLFFPPVKEMMTQISMPLPIDRKEWLKGFKEQQATILCDRVNI